VRLALRAPNRLRFSVRFVALGDIDRDVVKITCNEAWRVLKSSLSTAPGQRRQTAGRCTKFATSGNQKIILDKREEE